MHMSFGKAVFFVILRLEIINILILLIKDEENSTILPVFGCRIGFLSIASGYPRE